MAAVLRNQANVKWLARLIAEIERQFERAEAEQLHGTADIRPNFHAGHCTGVKFNGFMLSLPEDLHQPARRAAG